MKKISLPNLIRSVIAVAILVPFVALAYNPTGQPTFSLIGTKGVQSTKALVAISFNSSNAVYHIGEEPVISVDYTNLLTGYTLPTAPVTEQEGAYEVDVPLQNLSPNTPYSYYAMMTYNGQNYQTVSMRFQTPLTDTTTSTQGTTSVNPFAANTTTTTNVATTPAKTMSSTSPSLLTIFKSFGLSSGSTNLSSIVETGGYGFSNGVGLSITDSHARVALGDTFDYTIQYSNGNSNALRAARILVLLPDAYTFSSADQSDATYTQSGNIVTIYVGTIAANSSGSVIFTAHATGDQNEAVQTQANLVYTGGSVSAVDRDTYVGGSGSVLGASVFGVGFFPQTFFGWLFLIIVIIVIVIIARRYMTGMKKTPPPLQK